MRGGRRVLAVVVLAVAVLAAVWLARRRRESAPVAATPAARQGLAARAEGAPADAPRLSLVKGQPGVAARSLHGSVTADGQPVAGASVLLHDPNAGRGAIAATTTDGDGRFAFAELPAAEYIVAASAPRRAPAGRAVDLRGPDAARPIELRLPPCDLTMHGVVVDASGGAGLPQASVTIGHDVASAHVTADDAGEFSTCVVAGWDVAIVASADGYGMARKQVTVTDTRTVHRIALSPEAVIVGQVLRRADGVAVAGARVDAIAPGDHVAVTVSSDGEGRFRIVGARPGGTVLTASAPGLVARRGAYVRSRVGAETAMVLYLEPSTIASGKVLDEAEQPVAGAQVRFSGFAVGASGGAVTQSDGGFELPVSIGTAVRIDVADWEVVRPTTVAFSQPVTPLIVHVARKATVRGHVLYRGAPLADATVRVGQHGRSLADRRSKPDGSYEIGGLAPGQYEISAEAHELGAFVAPIPFAVEKGDTREGVDLVLDLEGSIAGVVVDEQGAPVSGAFVDFRLTGGDDVGYASTNQDGAFTARSLSGGGDYVAEVRFSARAPQTLSAPDGKPFAAVHVADGNSHVEGVRLVVNAARASISGRVVRASGAPVADAVVVAASVPPGEREYPILAMSRAPAARVVTDGDGAFMLDDLQAGAYAVGVMPSSEDALQLDVPTGQSGLVFTLPDLGSLDGTAMGFQSPPMIWVRGDGFGTEVSGDHFSLADLPAGEYIILASVAGEAAKATATVVAGETAHVELSSGGTAHVVGVVRRKSDTTPVADCICQDAFQGSMAVSDAEGHFEVDVPAGVDTGVVCMPSDTINGYAVTRLHLTRGETKQVEVELEESGDH